MFEVTYTDFQPFVVLISLSTCENPLSVPNATYAIPPCPSPARLFTSFMALIDNIMSALFEPSSAWMHSTPTSLSPRRSSMVGYHLAHANARSNSQPACERTASIIKSGGGGEFSPSTNNMWACGSSSAPPMQFRSHLRIGRVSSPSSLNLTARWIRSFSINENQEICV